MLSWIIGVLIVLGALFYGFMVMWGNGMSDAPTAEKTSQWPTLIGVGVGVGIIVAHHYGLL